MPEGTHMITLNLLKIFDSDVMQLQDSNTQTPENSERIQECGETKLSRINRGAYLDHINFIYDS